MGSRSRFELRSSDSRAKKKVVDVRGALVLQPEASRHSNMVFPDVVEEHARQDKGIAIGKFRQALLL